MCVFPNCTDVTKVWLSDGLQPNQLWFETKTSVVGVKAFSVDSQTGRYLLLKGSDKDSAVTQEVTAPSS